MLSIDLLFWVDKKYLNVKNNVCYYKLYRKIITYAESRKINIFVVNGARKRLPAGPVHKLKESIVYNVTSDSTASHVRFGTGQIGRPGDSMFTCFTCKAIKQQRHLLAYILVLAVLV